MSRSSAIADSINCDAPYGAELVSAAVVSCWACGEDVCRACSSVISYSWRRQRRRIRFCFNCQDQRGVGRGEKGKAA